MGLFSFFKKEPTRPPLQLHNTLSGKIEGFSPLSKRVVSMYNCGPTPYDRQHIGNMVPPVFAHIVRSALEVWGYEVKQVMNITDFGHLSGDNQGDPNVGDDKMMRGLAQEGLTPTLENMRILAEKYTQIFFDDIKILGVDTSKVIYPRASHYIPQQIELIKRLQTKGYAYDITDGVYFNTTKFAGYGKLGNINLEGQREGARVEENTEKKNPRDFVLWKKSENIGWDSPWGFGFPGWHIECTAMIFALLGEQIDIHTGGIEHIGVHHNNEIAQAEAATGKKYVKYWLHNAHITLAGKKISKSLGNTVYVSDIIEKGYAPRAFRYWLLTGHYRTPMNFTWEAIAGADTALKRLENLYLERPDAGEADEKFMNNFYTTFANDIDTARALALVWEHAHQLNKATFKKVDQILGLGLIELQPIVVPSDIQKMLDAREVARTNKDFTNSDTLRKQIEEAGFIVKDTPEGPNISKK